MYVSRERTQMCCRIFTTRYKPEGLLLHPTPTSTLFERALDLGSHILTHGYAAYAHSQIKQYVLQNEDKRGGGDVEAHLIEDRRIIESRGLISSGANTRTASVDTSVSESVHIRRTLSYKSGLRGESLSCCSLANKVRQLAMPTKHSRGRVASMVGGD